jgi:DNA repair protein RadC
MNKNKMPIQRCISGEEIFDLSNVELLAVLIGTGSKNYTVFELAQKILEKYENPAELYSAGLRELAQEDGIGLTKAVKIQCAIEFGKRIIGVQQNELMELSSPINVWKFLLPELAGQNVEKLFALVLNNKNRLIKKSIISVGTVNETLVHPREVFVKAIREGGTSVIVAHNHTSGFLTPSKEDITTTERLVEAGNIIGIKLLDHVIVSTKGFLSMRDEGYIG